jgi:hypothetical protein
MGVMDAAVFEGHRTKLTALLADPATGDRDTICDHLQSFEAARFKRISSNTVLVTDMRDLMKCGTMIKGSSLSCLALPYLALPCLALPCLALPCLALPCLALPCLALPCLAFNTFMLTRDVVNYYFEMLVQTNPEDSSLFLTSTYFYQKITGHSCCFHSTWHLPLVARRLPHAACRMPIM